MIRRYRTTRRSRERVSELSPLSFDETLSLDARLIYVDPNEEGPSFLGFGGALTRASQELLHEMDEGTRKEALSLLFGKEGLNYSLLRLTISSTDFGSSCYDYLGGGHDLSSFSFEEEEKSLLPLLREIAPMRNDWIRMASSWAPPAYMKENGDRCYGGHLRKECYGDYGEYLALYLDSMRKNGFPIDWMSVQNEPEAIQLWESMEVTAEEEGEIILKGILPALRRHGLDTKIIIWDHNKDEMVRRANVTLSRKEVDEAVWGIGYHWYVSHNFGNVELAKRLHPGKHLIFTEGCVELANIAYGAEGTGSPDLWEHAWRYGKNIIECLRRGTEAYIDWNLVLDERGGPTWVENYCEAPLIYDRQGKKLCKNPSYYYISQFSRFLERGSRMCYSQSDFEEGVDTLAFKNPGGEILLFVLNRGWNKSATLLLGGKKALVSLPSDSLTTFIIEEKGV